MTSVLACCRLPDETFSKPDSRTQPLWWLGCMRFMLRATLHQRARRRRPFHTKRHRAPPLGRGNGCAERGGRRTAMDVGGDG